MRYLIACAFAISTAFAAPGMIVSSAMGQAVCGPDSPASQLRPGGFCDNANSGRSLTGPVDPGCTEYLIPASFGVAGKGARIHVALTCECPTFQSLGIDGLQRGDRIHLAQPIPEACQPD